MKLHVVMNPLSSHPSTPTLLKSLELHLPSLPCRQVAGVYLVVEAYLGAESKPKRQPSMASGWVLVAW